MKKAISYLWIGTAAGVLNSLFGTGGGLVLVPLLRRIGKLEDKQALATSLAVTLPLSLVTLTLYLQRGSSLWAEGLPYLLGGIAGGAAAPLVFRRVPGVWLHRLFGVLILLGGVKAVLLL